MHIFRLGKREDIDALKRLWLLCFDDGKQFVDLFFERLFDKCICVCAVKGENIAAAQYLIECEFDGKKAYYGYAVGTDPAYRGEGICADMQKAVIGELEKKNVLYFLSPASEGLKGYYKRIGFADGFFENRISARLCREKKPLLKINADEYVTRRNEYLFARYGSKFVKWSADVLSVFYDFYMSGGVCFAVSDVNESLHIDELLGDKDDAERALSCFVSAKSTEASVCIASDSCENKAVNSLVPEEKSGICGYFALTLG
ncbi:MAG: GNAT family N-acetyltransferase [Clostridia bacterium]|nr:GNAT family N-acetyltransferase [Clostridia bacterium]